MIRRNATCSKCSSGGTLLLLAMQLFHTEQRRSVLRRSAVEKLIHRELEQSRVSEESETKAMMRSHGHFHHQHPGSSHVKIFETTISIDDVISPILDPIQFWQV